MNNQDKRLIEDFLPLKEISAAASKEKAARRGHISTIHLWWARRPLVSCRATIYGALVPANFLGSGRGAEEIAQGRAKAARFIAALCGDPIPNDVLKQAREHIFDAHRPEHANQNACTDSRPKILDMFAGGGAIPLEALRLGCDAYATDLNPVAHLIQIVTLVYPQKYGAPDRTATGALQDGTWAGLPHEVRVWGEKLLGRIGKDLDDLYPRVPDPECGGPRNRGNKTFWEETSDSSLRYLVPTAYLWTRTVPCKNPNCRAAVPLVRQTWLCKRSQHYVALKPVPDKTTNNVRFEVITTTSEKGLGFDPDAGSSRGNATCPFCGTVADNDYIKAQGQQSGFANQLMAVVCIRPGSKGKIYIAGHDIIRTTPSDETLHERLAQLCAQTRLSVPDEPLPKPGTLGFRVQPYGFKTWGDLFTTRQKVMLLTFAAGVRQIETELTTKGYAREHVTAITTCLGLMQSTIANSNSTICRWIPQNQQMGSTFSRQALPMTWDFAEIAPFGGGSGDSGEYLVRLVEALDAAAVGQAEAHVIRCSATELPWSDSTFDAVITDPPYYDNVPYSDLSDYFYVWLKRTVGHLHPEHFASQLTPKRSEAIAEPARFGGSIEKARTAYEQMMFDAFEQASRVLKPGGHMSVIYAHKTTLGWATLVNALRKAGFVVTEAWPLDTEKPGRLRAVDSAALASSIVLVARKRERARRGVYETDVRPELESVVHERVSALWEQGISGADLVISCVGAGLRAFTRFLTVEYSNGDEVPAERFLTEVETAVLEAILGRLSEDVGAKNMHGLAGMDAATRFYTLWRYTYKSSELEAGEAIIFANGTHVELDGVHGLSQHLNPLVEKSKGKYRLLDYAERGGNSKLGHPTEDGTAAPLIDVLQRLLWLMERQPTGVREFIKETHPNLEQLRLLAQALAGPALKGGELDEVASGSELAALTKLSANWRAVIGDALDISEAPLFKTARS